MATQMPFMQETPQALPEVTLIQMITARWVSQAIAVAARLGIADLLGDGRNPARSWLQRRARTRGRFTGCCARCRASEYLRKTLQKTGPKLGRLASA